MKSFIYTIKDEVGIHARPAGLLAKKAKEFDSVITVTKDDKTVIATKLMAIMSMGVKQGDTVTITAEGTDESNAIKAMEKFFADNL